VDYVLYLRWRWQNPWRGNIVKNAYSEKSMFDVNAEWSPDMFEQKRLYFIDEELEQVWAGKKTAQQALDDVTKRGNALLEKFDASNK
jgi:ABC-type glycerol-3-phosphate transport system substrate-binding protein